MSWVSCCCRVAMAWSRALSSSRRCRSSLSCSGGTARTASSNSSQESYSSTRCLRRSRGVPSRTWSIREPFVSPMEMASFATSSAQMIWAKSPPSSRWHHSPTSASFKARPRRRRFCCALDSGTCHLTGHLERKAACRSRMLSTADRSRLSNHWSAILPGYSSS